MCIYAVYIGICIKNPGNARHSFSQLASCMQEGRERFAWRRLSGSIKKQQKIITNK
jgi:hypothetical protein